ncbi:MAG: S8 family serine peptidase [candidate division Zixibacteria bacterium]|nr:S8 family serine peptidase [candidate division Zixibacteria bacterium]
MKLAKKAGLMLLLSLILSIPASYGAELSPGLEEALTNNGPDEPVKAIVYLKSQFDTRQLDLELSTRQANRQERHEEVITALRDHAQSTQDDLINLMEQAKLDGRVVGYRPFWIVNAIAVQANRVGIDALRIHPDVDKLVLDREVELIEPVEKGKGTPPEIASVEAGLRAIKADSAWMMGYTGQGRLVCNFDTGVDGYHPALNQKWRGWDLRYMGHPEWAWYDSVSQSSFPFDSNGHGTHTMGTICGLGQTTGDTIGVAHGAQWIAAACIDTGGGTSDILAAYEWCADPDRNPQTVWDVPDVCSNSWGYSPLYHGVEPCDETFWDAIDNCEAAGIVVIFAAGNEGPNPSTLRTPGDRATTDVNILSVGAINGNNPDYPIAGFSSRGPCDCTPTADTTFKPEVVAPGVQVRSSVPGGGYEGNWSGTSMACPHVAGAAAILRQVNPDATVDDVKFALLSTAVDLGETGEDNNYGMGIIDIMAAIDALPTGPSPYLYISDVITPDGNDSIPYPGEEINGIVTLTNSGSLPAEDVFALLSTEDSFATVTQDSAFFGDIDSGNAANNEDYPYVISISNDTPEGYVTTFVLDINAVDYRALRTFSLRVGPPPEGMIADHDIGDVKFTMSNYGQYGLAPASVNPQNGSGFRYPQSGQNHLFEGALMIGTGADRLSSGARHIDETPGDDFVPSSELVVIEPGVRADEDIVGSYNDLNANNPMNVEITQTSMAYAVDPFRNFVIIEYLVINNGSEELSDIYAAQFADWDFLDATADLGNFSRDYRLGYMYQNQGSNYRGIAVLNEEGVSSFACVRNDPDVYYNFDDAMKWDLMTRGFDDTTYYPAEDGSMCITTGPFNLGPGESDTIAFAYIGANDLSDLEISADNAYMRYWDIVGVDDGSTNIPYEFALSQNYPNPFNPSTTIGFTIPENGNVKLEVLNVMGQRVATVVDGRLLAGHHSVQFDGSELSSGVYFYRLRTESNTEVRKMILLK